MDNIGSDGGGEVWNRKRALAFIHSFDDARTVHEVASCLCMQVGGVQSVRVSIMTMERRGWRIVGWLAALNTRSSPAVRILWPKQRIVCLGSDRM
jgi:hypothetical protein